MFRPKRQKPIEIQVEPVVELDYDLLEIKLKNKKNDWLWSAVFNLLCDCDYGWGCIVDGSMHYACANATGTIYYKNKRGYRKFKRKVHPSVVAEEIKKRSGFSLLWDPIITDEFVKSLMAGEFDV